MSPRCSIGCVQNDFWAYGVFRAKPCTYLASRLALSANGPKQASIWASSSRSTIGCVQNDLWAYGTFGTKPCTYLTPILTLSLNGPKWDSIWPTSPRCSIRCVQNDFQACGTLGASHAPILLQYEDSLQADRNEIPHDLDHLGVLSGVSKAIFEPVVGSVQIVHLSCVKNSTISNGPKWASTWASSF
jgi:hypothetical protein